MIPLRDDNPTKITPVVTITFIVVCVGVFLWQVTHDPEGQQLITYGLGAIPVTLFGERQLSPDIAIVPTYVTVFTSMFLHGGWMHLIGNMAYLWIFGNNIEDAMGHVRYTFFYIICGIIAVFAHALPNADSAIPMVGASGAISGVLGAYLLLHPHARVLLFIPLGFFAPLIRLKAMWVLGAWFVMQLVSSAMNAGNEGGGVAFGAHIGGFIAGIVLIPLFKNRNVPLENPFKGWTR